MKPTIKITFLRLLNSDIKLKKKSQTKTLARFKNTLKLLPPVTSGNNSGRSVCLSLGCLHTTVLGNSPILLAVHITDCVGTSYTPLKVSSLMSFSGIKVQHLSGPA